MLFVVITVETKTEDVTALLKVSLFNVVFDSTGVVLSSPTAIKVKLLTKSVKKLFKALFIKVVVATAIGRTYGACASELLRG